MYGIAVCLFIFECNGLPFINWLRPKNSNHFADILSNLLHWSGNGIYLMLWKSCVIKHGTSSPRYWLQPPWPGPSWCGKRDILYQVKQPELPWHLQRMVGYPWKQSLYQIHDIPETFYHSGARVWSWLLKASMMCVSGGQTTGSSWLTTWWRKSRFWPARNPTLSMWRLFMLPRRCNALFNMMNWIELHWFNDYTWPFGILATTIYIFNMMSLHLLTTATAEKRQYSILVIKNIVWWNACVLQAESK